ncbi:hypothetical protein ACQPXH_27535 [Nocardia sp. CA-135953]|uniref:hypothetical protein n=1 Tax=Nocardia sp. CA-135953 TaxID=3239978 RepID=UPI003D975201
MDNVIHGPQSHSGMSRPPLHRAILARARPDRIDHHKPGRPESAARRFDPTPKPRALLGWRWQRDSTAGSHDLDIEAEHLGEQPIVIGDIRPDEEGPSVLAWMRRNRAEVRPAPLHVDFHGPTEMGGHGQRSHMFDLHHDSTDLRRVDVRGEVAHLPVVDTA